MSGTQPVAVYAMKVPPGDIMVPAVPDFAAMFRVSMAAIDPSATPEYLEFEEKKPPRATLKLIRIPADMMVDDSEEDEDYEDLVDAEDDEDTSSEAEDIVGPSDPEKAKKRKKLNAVKDVAKADDTSVDDESNVEDALSDDDAAAKAALSKIMKGKDKAGGDEAKGGNEDQDEDEDEGSLEMEEVVICTLDPEKNYQQPLDFVVGEDERIFFKVTGTHTVHLTGNYVVPTDDGHAQLYSDDEEQDRYDLSPDEDELNDLVMGEDDSDELDDLEDPRIVEMHSEEDGEQEKIPKLAKEAGNGKNKRPAEEESEEEEEANLDNIMSKSLKSEQPRTNGEVKLTKSQKKKLKKLKKNDGEPAAPPAVLPATAASPASTETKKNLEPGKKEAVSNGAEKKVQFAKNLEQGPTPSATPPAKEAKKSATEKPETKTSGTLGVKEVHGVTIDDRKLGQGPAAKKGNKVEMRYIGKLEDGKVFDANKKGKAFSFKLGAGEVIKGWDIGVVGMTAGGERRLTIPSNLGYGSKGAPPDIPPNSKLVFDVKLLTVK